MLRYTFCLACALLLAIVCVLPADATSVASVNMYGYPMFMGLGGSGAPGVPGGAYTMSNEGIDGLSDVTSRYGVITASSVSQTPDQSSYGYFGPDWNGITLGVNFGWPTATHDAATTAYAKDLAYEASLDNSAIAFPGFGVGSLGVSFPSLTSNKADIKYAESVRFTLTTESDTMPLSGFGYPLGLGLGYLGVGVNGGLGTSGALGTPFFYANG
jgi:hypothetical protein